MRGANFFDVQCTGSRKSADFRIYASIFNLPEVKNQLIFEFTPRFLIYASIFNLPEVKNQLIFEFTPRFLIYASIFNLPEVKNHLFMIFMNSILFFNHAIAFGIS